METETPHVEAKRLIRENIHKIKIYEGCRNIECGSQNEIWHNCNNFSDRNRFYVKEDYEYSGFTIDVAILERCPNSDKLCAVIEILDESRTKTRDALELYRFFGIGTLFNCRDIIAVSVEEVLRIEKEDPEARIWFLQNHLNYHTCMDCFSKLLK